MKSLGIALNTNFRMNLGSSYDTRLKLNLEAKKKSRFSSSVRI